MKINGVSFIRGGKINGVHHDAATYADATGFKPAATPIWAQELGTQCVGENLFLDAGRQSLAYLLGLRTPVADFGITHFGVGTGTTPPTTADVALEAPVEFSTGVTKKLIDGTLFPDPFIVQVNYTIGASECNGYLLTEVGFYNGRGDLVVRLVRQAGINKVSNYAPELSHFMRL